MLFALLFALLVVGGPAGAVALHGIRCFNKRERAALDAMGVKAYADLL
jgi:hypothetical protein